MRHHQCAAVQNVTIHLNELFTPLHPPESATYLPDDPRLCSRLQNVTSVRQQRCSTFVFEVWERRFVRGNIFSGFGAWGLFDDDAFAALSAFSCFIAPCSPSFPWHISCRSLDFSFLPSFPLPPAPFFNLEPPRRCSHARLVQSRRRHSCCGDIRRALPCHLRLVFRRNRSHRLAS